MNILVTGATGFVGGAVVRALQAAGHTVFAGSRRGQPVHGAAGVVADVTELGSLQRAVGRAEPEAVVHLVGIIAEQGDQTFQRVHIDGTRNVLASVPRSARYLHMSALGADSHSRSGYSRSKGIAEDRVRASGLRFTIFQPSLIFGPGDDFFGRVLKELVSLPPVVPQIGDGQFPFRPVSVQDVAQAFTAALTEDASLGGTYPLTGPAEYTFRELLQLELRALHRKKLIVPVPLALMNLLVPLMGLLPSPPITGSQYLMLKQGNTADPEPARSLFRLPMQRLEHALPEIVGGGQ